MPIRSWEVERLWRDQLWRLEDEHDAEDPTAERQMRQVGVQAAQHRWCLLPNG